MKRVVGILGVATVLTLGLSLALPAQETPPGVVILKGNPMGGVKFDHAAHTKAAGEKCDTCHHASKPEKPLKAQHEKCQDCHTKAATAPMKTTTRLAFHDAAAKSGTCIGCHTKEAAAGKKPPLKCTECHKKENK
jgi:sRNA-binding protein